MSSVSYSQNDPSSGMEGSKEEKSMEPVGVKTSAGMLYGNAIDESAKQLTYGDLLGNAESVNNTVVTVRGVVAEVCQAMGCWMVMTDGKTSVRATTGHNFFLPKDISGKEVIITGTFKMTEISEDDAKHYNEESSNPKDESEIVGPQQVYVIDATGIEVLDSTSDSN
ncbi:MAG: DUF4920 domain-containing protein [Ignavibacteria bacterium]